MKAHSKIVIVSPHPDDETLGAGGTLLRLRKEGNKIFWLNFTDMRKEYGYSARDVLRRTLEIEKVIASYSFNGFCNLGLKPACISEYPRKELVEKVTKILKKIKPEMIILPFRNDVHSDHRAVFELVYSCTKSFRAKFIKKILMMEVLSETEFSSSDNGFVPNFFVDISGYLARKIQIAKIFKSELKRHPFPRSFRNIKSLATFRGGAAGCKYAESFMVLKEIW